MHGDRRTMRIQVAGKLAVRFGILLCLAAVGACNSGQRGGDSSATSGVTTEGGTTTRQASAPDTNVGTKRDKAEHPAEGTYTPPAGEFRGQLPKALDEYANDAPGFYKIAQRNHWRGYRVSRKCKDPGGACDRANAGELVAQGIQDAHTIPVAVRPEVKGVIVGRVYNPGNYDDATLPIPGGLDTPDHYYFVVEPGRSWAAKVRIAVVRFRTDGKPLQALTILTDKASFISCGHPRVQGRTVGWGDFNACRPGTQPGEWGTGLTTPVDSVTALLSVVAPPWFSCSDGCCSVQWIAKLGEIGDSARARPRPRPR